MTDPTDSIPAVLTPEQVAEILPGLLEHYAPAAPARDDLEPEAGAAPEHHAEPAAEPVGYGRPPAPHRFTKGVSGNPLGRPRTRPADPRARPDLSDIERALRRRVDVEINGRRRRMPLTHALVTRLTEKALEDGELIALRELLRLCVDTEAARAAAERREAEEAEARRGIPVVRFGLGASDGLGGLMKAFHRGMDEERRAAERDWD